MGRVVARLALAMLLATTSPAAADAPLYADSRALVIAVTKYEHAEHWSSNPELAVHARTVASALRRHGFAVRLVIDDPDRFHTLPPCADLHSFAPGICVERHPQLDAATLGSVMRRFLFAEDAEPEAASRFLLWYSGHGHVLPVVQRQVSISPAERTDSIDDGEGLLVGADAPAANAPGRRFLQHVVPMRDLGTWSRLSPARHVLFVLEACFAGTVFDPRSDVKEWRTSSYYLERPARQFLTAGGNEQVEVSNRFVKTFIKGIDGHAGSNLDQVITASELGRWVQSDLIQKTEQRFTPQWGDLLDWRFRGGNFMFSPRSPTPAARIRAGRALPSESTAAPILYRERPDLPTPQLVDVTAAHDPATWIGVGVSEVTIGEWEACAKRERCPASGAAGDPRAPVTGVSRADVARYLAWLEAETGSRYRLPTGDEWRRWIGEAGGHEPGIVCRDCSAVRPDGPALAGGAATTNGRHLANTVGNVWEWTDTCEDVDGSRRCHVAGGSWANGRAFATAEATRPVPEDARSAAVGFRVVRVARDGERR